MANCFIKIGLSGDLEGENGIYQFERESLLEKLKKVVKEIARAEEERIKRVIDQRNGIGNLSRKSICISRRQKFYSN